MERDFDAARELFSAAAGQGHHGGRELCEKVDDLIFKTFKNRSYDPKDAQKWTNDMSEVIIKVLQDSNKDLKCVVNMIILQRGDSGFHMSASCCWDSKNDGNFCKKYPFEYSHVSIH